jgi:hypothetical protein
MQPPADTALTLVDSVRCLDCATVYSKPRAGGTMSKNPGCPHCGYVGWVPDSVRAASLRDRFGGDRRQRRSA